MSYCPNGFEKCLNATGKYPKANKKYPKVQNGKSSFEKRADA